MAEINLTNKADIAGTYGDSASPITFSSNDVSTTIVQGFTVTKTADKTYWVDGQLTYTITITNDSGGTLTSGTLTDKIDTSIVNFNTSYGVQINGTSSTNFTYSEGTLTVTLPDLAGNASATVTFQVVLL